MRDAYWVGFAVGCLYGAFIYETLLRKALRNMFDAYRLRLQQKRAARRIIRQSAIDLRRHEKTRAE